MKCPNCQFDNKEEASFCKKCGTKLQFACPSCGNVYEKDSLFCEQCGQILKEPAEEEKEVAKAEGERKHVTVLFSDLSGYTAMSEKLDPEELKEITTSIFRQISEIIDKYEGFVEKFIGDAVMAIFGVPRAHEDDPIRAIWAARKIHELVDSMSPELEENIGRPISMHTGINTGLVVTGEVDMRKGTHGLSGDTINVASRLSSLAKSGEILVSADTYRQAEGHFTFESLEPTLVKGKTEPVQVHRVLSQKERPITIHRLSGLRADLIGRKVELAELRQAVENLKKREGRIFSICGDAGTGKSRLIEEFKATLDLDRIQWLEGHAYAYAQNVPYFPLIDLLDRVFQIEEGDSPEKVRQKVESGVENLVGKKENVASYLGSLYSLSYPEIEEASPELWKSRVRDAVQMILSALAQGAPTIFLLEDLHWADPSFIELLRHNLLEIRHPAIVLCVYRPTFNLFPTHQLDSIAKVYQEIRVQDLSSSEAQDMVESLLDTEKIPSDLLRLIQDRAEGNPFYLEELVNSLIESKALIPDNGNWKVTRTISGSEISSSIHGVISGRLDRLEKEMKRVLQEASVIGRTFHHGILKRITDLKDQCELCITGLERLDLIRTRSHDPELEYIFKHALTQEVVYNSLLKKERKEMHDRIGVAMEQLFQDRLTEFYETLAFHFRHGQSVPKAVYYLMKSGEKSLKRFSLEESHHHYNEAFDILTNIPEKSKSEKNILIDIILEWCNVFHYTGDFKGMANLLTAHVSLAESLGDKERLGMFYAWLGHVLRQTGDLKDSYKYLLKALKLGEEIDNLKVIGYACAWLAWTCPEMGLLDEAVLFGKRAQEISGLLKADQILFQFSLWAIGLTYNVRGESKKAKEVVKILLDYGRSHSDIRSTFLGHLVMGWCHLFITGYFASAIESFRNAIQVTVDPWFTHGGSVLLGLAYANAGQIQEAENILKKEMRFTEEFGIEYTRTMCQCLRSIVMLAKGDLDQGVKVAKDLSSSLLENEYRWRYALVDYVLGKVYVQIALGTGPKSLSFLTKNIAFLLKNVPFASKKAEDYLNRVIGTTKELGVKALSGQAYLDLGLLYKAKGRTDLARDCLSEAINLFEKCEAEAYLKEAKEALASLA